MLFNRADPRQQSVIARAPLRVSFGGGGTDLAVYYERFGGFVVSTAVDRYCYVMARPAADGGVHITSADYRTWQSFPSPGAVPLSEPLSLPKAVVRWFVEQGMLANGVSLFLASEVTSGTGLGGSSSMTVALISALSAFSKLALNVDELAELACEIEIERLGMPIGKQDQYASAYGGFNTMDFTEEGVVVQPVALPQAARQALNMRLMLFATGKTHNSADILRQQREDTVARPAVTQRLHSLKQLGQDMREVLQAGDLDGFGHLLHRSWQVKRQLSNKISDRAIDAFYAAARATGAIGGKICGAGGGGFLLLYCPLRHQRRVREQMRAKGLQELRCGFGAEGAQIVSGPEAIHRPVRSIRRQNAMIGPGNLEVSTMDSYIEQYWHELALLARAMPFDAIDEAVQLLLDCHRRGGTVFVVGNGGSAATASHFACDLAKGTRSNGRPTFRVIPLTDNMPLVTAWANDDDFEQIFAEQLAPFIRPRDVLVAISTSGNSPNVVAAAEVAHQTGATTIAMTGSRSCKLHQIATLNICVPEATIEQVEDAHLAVAHSLCVALREHVREPDGIAAATLEFSGNGRRS